MRQRKIVIGRISPFGSMSYKRDPKLERIEYSIKLGLLFGVLGFMVYGLFQ